MNRTFVVAAATFATVAFAQAPLPEGAGKAVVEKSCTVCHDLSRIQRSGFSEAGWRNHIAMMKNVGAQVPDEQMETLVAYLARNFPEKTKPKPAVISGSVQVDIREWEVPTTGTRPHDPLIARDGSLWYTGQFANHIGRLDRTTGQIREFRLKHPTSGPHGLVEDSKGHIWFTANSAGYIGELDPATGEVKEYPMPEAAAHDPHTPVFDQGGRLWFTVQGGNRIGRLDPKTGRIELVRPPSPNARPYGIKVNSKGEPFAVLFGTNKIARVDPQTMAVREYVLPHKESRPRRMAITADDKVWYADYTRGVIGRLDPFSGDVKEWPSPGGSTSQPYGMATDGQVIWYSESGVSPNTLVRFDPASQKFQSWTVPSGGGVIRHMDMHSPNELVIACSGVNRIGLVTIR
jgi:virginiamycin B lyase